MSDCNVGPECAKAKRVVQPYPDACAYICMCAVCFSIRDQPFLELPYLEAKTKVRHETRIWRRRMERLLEVLEVLRVVRALEAAMKLMALVPMSFLKNHLTAIGLDL